MKQYYYNIFNWYTKIVAPYFSYEFCLCISKKICKPVIVFFVLLYTYTQPRKKIHFYSMRMLLHTNLRVRREKNSVLFSHFFYYYYYYCLVIVDGIIVAVGYVAEIKFWFSIYFWQYICLYFCATYKTTIFLSVSPFFQLDRNGNAFAINSGREKWRQPRADYFVYTLLDAVNVIGSLW